MSSLREQITALEKEVYDKKKMLARLREELPAQPVSDYVFKDWAAKAVKLSDLFGERDELLIAFNMGKSCSYCTLWADGYNGLAAHLDNRAGFAVVSPDTPEVQRAFAEGRGWRFKMVSHSENDFGRDMGYVVDKNGETYYLPGVMSFSKDSEGNIFRHANAAFGPGDNYCVMWDFMDLLPKGANKWAPKYAYD